jgi:predicted  nucleic acid-binding Zn-ribbon protein
MRIENPFSISIPVNTYVNYPTPAPPTTSETGSSQATVIQGLTEARPPGPARESSEESGITAELNGLHEIERLKNEVKYLRAEKAVNQRLRKEVAQLNQLLEDEKRSAQQKDEKLAWLKKRVKDLEYQDLKASEYQAASARTRHHDAEEMQEKENRIEELEQRCQILEENNKRLQSNVSELKGITKDAQDHIRYSRLQNHITDLENSVKDLRLRRDTVQGQLGQANDDEKDSLYDETNNLSKDLKTMNAHLAKLRADFASMPNPADLAGDFGAHSRSGSYDTQYDPMPDLVTDMSSLASASPPQSESLDSMDGYRLNRGYQVGQSHPNAEPWAKTVETPKGSLPRARDQFAGTGKQRTGPYR